MNLAEANTLRRAVDASGRTLPMPLRRPYAAACRVLDNMNERANVDGLGLLPFALVPWFVAAAILAAVGAAGVGATIAGYKVADAAGNAAVKVATTTGAGVERIVTATTDAAASVSRWAMYAAGAALAVFLARRYFR